MTYLMQFQRDQQRDYSLTTVPCIGILRPPKMPESSKMSWNNYRSGKETGSWSSIPRPEKCQVTNIISKRNIISHKYKIHGHTLEVVDSAKYLGLSIHKSLKWNDYINQVTKKANSTLAFLRRNLHNCPRPTKSLC